METERKREGVETAYREFESIMMDLLANCPPESKEKEAWNKKLRKELRKLLEAFCHEELKDSREEYGSLFFKIDYICRKHQILGKDKYALQSVRKHTKKWEIGTDDLLLYDVRILTETLSRLYGLPVSASLLAMLPQGEYPIVEKIEKADERTIRCVVKAWDAWRVLVESEDETAVDDELVVLYVTEENTSLAYLYKIFKVGMQLNLLDCKYIAKNTLRVQYIIVEPDFLVDISAIAGCFNQYGHHPLAFIVNQLKRKPNSQAILLGNFASDALDDVIHSPGCYDVNKTLKDNRKDKVLEFCTCPSFDEDAFVVAAKDQANNLEETVRVLFREYERDKAILEPSFVCERLGVQGRVDLMTTDFRLLVEQKSGKNNKIERTLFEGQNRILENHYVQLLLYFGVLISNFKKSPNEIEAKLLYSKYQPQYGLVNVGFERNAFLEVMKFRNQLVATLFLIANGGFEKIIDHLTPEVLNVKNVSNVLYSQWQLPELVEITGPLHQLLPQERIYFCRMLTFVYKEMLMGKVGKTGGIGCCVADLWNMPLDKKKETGNIYTGLTVVEKKQSTGLNGYDLILFNIPSENDGVMSNFRRGDMVYVYAYDERKEPDIRSSLLFSGIISELTEKQIEVYLGDGQQNPELIDCFYPTFAIEHAFADASYNGAVRGMHEFITAPVYRKHVFMGLSSPHKDMAQTLSRRYYNNENDDMLLRCRQAFDYFLLIGPPGTGKTHKAIRYIMMEELTKKDSSVLLLAYTNRAVDELCRMLDEIGIDFVRMGRAYGCDKHYRNHLIKNIFEGDEQDETEARKKRLGGYRIFVSTVSNLMSRPNILYLKQFSLAIVDEASQILEPDIAGIIGAHFKSKERCDIDKFVFVGDYKQLPAIVQQSFSESGVAEPVLNDMGYENCRISLFQRLVRWERRNGREDFIGILTRQGRMHPDVAEFPSQRFYLREHLTPLMTGHQKDSVLEYDKVSSIDRLDAILKAHRVIFIPSPDVDEKNRITDSANETEAEYVAECVCRIARFAGADFNADETLGIIVPYRSQIAMVRKKMETKLKENELWTEKMKNITIDTVERFQGSQRDVILYSFTVSRLFQLDFLTQNNFLDDMDNSGRIIDPKLNVAMTRARKQMIFTGNPNILSNNSVFSDLMEYVKEHHGWIEPSCMYESV